MNLFILLVLSFAPLWASIPTQRVLVISDLNGSYGSIKYGSDVYRAIDRIKELGPDLVLSTGDMVAGQKAGIDHEAMWNSFHQIVTEPLALAKIPFAVTVGNHDGSGYIRYQDERELFKSEWEKFRPQLNFSDDSNYPIYYSFESKGVVFFSIDTTMVGHLSVMQLNWLAMELKKNVDKKFKVVFTHVPLFQFNQSNPNESFFDFQLAELLKKYEVNLYLTGHHHVYYPGFYEGIHFVSQSCLGSGQEKLIGSNEVSPRTITVLDFFDSHFEINALLAPDFSNTLDHSKLPRTIEAKGKRIELRTRSIVKEGPSF
jgi:hypothetical protein